MIFLTKNTFLQRLQNIKEYHNLIYLFYLLNQTGNSNHTNNETYYIQWFKKPRFKKVSDLSNVTEIDFIHTTFVTRKVIVHSKRCFNWPVSLYVFLNCWIIEVIIISSCFNKKKKKIVHYCR